MKTRWHWRLVGGFSFLELLFVMAVFVILVALCLPRLVSSPRRSIRIACMNNLKNIGLSFRQWALDHGDKLPDQVSDVNGGTIESVGTGVAYIHLLVMSNELNTPKILLCPADKKRFAATNWNTLRNSNLSYFVGLDITEKFPQMLLSGDDNFTINGKKPRSGLVLLSTNDAAAWLPTPHDHQGNILLADGSVKGFSSTNLNAAFRSAGVATNRLLMP